MSHRATIWAIRQRGLKPAAKILLWHLADRHNSETGRCDPSQDCLAADCEMSRASVKRHLLDLEAAGFIQRIRRFDPRTHRQESTFYRLVLDDDSSALPSEVVSEVQNEPRAEAQNRPEPWLKSASSRGSNCDTNLGSEPGKNPRARAAGRTAATGTGRFLEFLQVYPPTPHGSEGSAMRAFRQLVTDGTDPEDLIAAAGRYRSERDGQAQNFTKAAANFLRDGDWRKYRRVAMADDQEAMTSLRQRAAALAEKIRRGQPVNPTVLTPMMCDLVAANGIPAEQLRRLAGGP